MIDFLIAVALIFAAFFVTALAFWVALSVEK
jgi:hypothetical protein